MTLTHPRSLRGVWVFPLAVVVVFGLLVLAGVSGSSISLLSVKPPVTIGSTVTPAQDPAILLGKPRPIRSDEWAISTPLSVGQTADGFDPDPWIGLTPTDLSAISYSAPQRALATLMRPETWGYLVLGPDRGLSWAWWFPWVTASVSLYVLLLILTRRPGLSAGLAMLGVLTPYAAWWTSPSPNLFIAFSTAATAAYLLAVQTTRWAGRALLAILAGYFATALMLTLYPPWAITTALVMGALVVGVLLDSRPPLKGLALASAITAVTAALIGAWWLRGAVDDLEAIANTIYPGQRVSGPGETRLDQLLSAYANPYPAVTDVQPALSNQSEIAGVWLAIPVIALVIMLVFPRVVGGRPHSDPSTLVMGRCTVGSLTVVFAVLLGWSLWSGFPELLGKALLLTRVPGVRVPLALGLALLVLVVALNQLDLGRAGPRWLLPVVLCVPLLTAVLAAWAAVRLYPGLGAKWLLAVVLGAVIVAGALTAVAMNRGVGVVLPLAVVYALVSVALVNPVYRGLGPLRTDPVALYALEVSRRDAEAKAVVLSGRELNALVRGGGMQVLSGTTLYPNEGFWDEALPDDPGLWNNYRNFEWSYDPQADPVSGTVTAPDAALLQVDLCDPVIRELGYRAVFAPELLDAPCLTLETTLERSNGQEVRVYVPSSDSGP